MSESALQKKIIKWLKDHGVYVIKTKPIPGIPTGCPDIIGLYQDQWLAIEVKKSETAEFQPGQKPTLAHLGKNNYFVFVAHPENWANVQAILQQKFFLD